MVATAVVPRIPTPLDPALPLLPVLLGADEMAPFLRRSLGPDAQLSDVRVHHVRYIPGRKAVVRYDVGLDGSRYDAVAAIAAGPYLARRAASPKNLALARLVDGRSPAATPLRYEPELDALIHWYPLDLELPALAEPPTRLFDQLEAAGVRLRDVGRDYTTLAYKPRRRAVLRVGAHVLKFYASRDEFVAATVGLQFAGSLPGVRTAKLEGHLPASLVTAQTLISGATPARSGSVAREAGQLLRELQTASAWVNAFAPRGVHANLYAARPASQLETAAASARYIVAIVPGLGGRLEALLRELEATMPSIDRLVFCHGDFSARQLLVTLDGLAVVDFDAMRLAPAALDPATYVAHLVFGGPDDLDDASDVLEKLLEGYGGRPPGLSWYLAACILRHSRRPFRYLEENWPERIEGMVTAAEDALRR